MNGATTDYCSGKNPFCCGLTSVSDQRSGVIPGSGDRGPRRTGLALGVG